ncbi:MAG: hypothetical protein H7A23_15305 [Leptospiraceae bacterium]|nr:hypothetical protein [Leptospiraceae bacterium]
MQANTRIKPITIQIKGDYWDSYIYGGKLYLWNFNQDIEIIVWDKLIENLSKKEEEKSVLRHAFINCKDLSYKRLTSEKLSDALGSLTQKSITITKEYLKSHTIKTIKKPLKCLPTGIEFTEDEVYIADESGFYKTDRDFTKPKKMWDCRLLSIKSNYYKSKRVSLSAGSEGLFEYDDLINNGDKDGKKVEKNIHQITEKHSSFSDWLYDGIYNTSINPYSSFWFNFTNKKEPKLIQEKDIFKKQSCQYISWGYKDKIYGVSNDGMEEVSIKNGKNFDAHSRKPVLNGFLNQKPISAGVGEFGKAIEYENGLVVVLDNNEHYKIASDKICNWRLFNRSKKYLNQLHVVFEDKVVVYSLNSWK